MPPTTRGLRKQRKIEELRVKYVWFSAPAGDPSEPRRIFGHRNPASSSEFCPESYLENSPRERVIQRHPADPSTASRPRNRFLPPNQPQYSAAPDSPTQPGQRPKNYHRPPTNKPIRSEPTTSLSPPPSTSVQQSTSSHTHPQSLQNQPTTLKDHHDHHDHHDHLHHPLGLEEITSRSRTIRQHATAGRWRAALNALRDLVKEDVPVHTRTYNAALKALAGAGEWEKALTLASDMRQRAVEVGTGVDTPEVVAVLRDLTISPDSYTHTSVLSALARARQWERALEYFSKFCANANVQVFNSYANAMARGGQWQRAIGLLEEMETRGINGDVYTFSTIITACVKARKPKAAKKVFTAMRSHGVTPNEVTLTAMIPVYAGSGDWKTALA
eukprot:1091431-Amorphochlora_amoeboformis.AAC.2